MNFLIPKAKDWKDRPFHNHDNIHTCRDTEIIVFGNIDILSWSFNQVETLPA